MNLVFCAFFIFSNNLFFLLKSLRAYTVEPVLEVLKEAPAKMERTIASIEKQSRALEKEAASASADATELTLKDLISKLK